ncbi:MAG: UvrD-helicase domain-containing protein, partial [Myxococcales bacterium]
MNRLEPLQISLAGTSLIEASAGTGKTYTITTLYLRLLLERDLVASEILVVTYTRAATAELRD